MILTTCALALVAFWLKILWSPSRSVVTHRDVEVTSELQPGGASARLPSATSPRRLGRSPASPLWAPSPTSPPPVSNSAGDEVVFHTLQFELDLDAGGMLPQGEPLASYLVPGSRAPELQSDLDTIAVATNRLVSLRDQVTSLRQTLQTDTRDYLAGIKATDQSDQNDRAIAVKKLLDMQALYAERKLEFQKEIASLQLSLQDPLPVLDQKVSLRQEAITRYENDITKLESAIHQLQQEVYTATQERRGTVDRMESSYHQAAQASLQSMTNAAAQLREQFRAVNTLIQAYNGKLKRYGVQQP